ncbi:protein FAM166A [Xenopus laevis]|uniref:Ciliary microtubule inner protein 2A-C-like domain-containing protein n=2 Tax=Xenopus laevis TaxID=8355 RepID=A0A974C5I9_XENLA|nr:protein FAM166A [Xenopus laevis]OCT66898.1 hypothetical protein XELAEV_18038179mg [Xenopus laevis]
MTRSSSCPLPGYEGLAPQFHYQPGEFPGVLHPDPHVQRDPAAYLPHPTDPSGLGSRKPPREGQLTLRSPRLSGKAVPPRPCRQAGNSVSLPTTQWQDGMMDKEQNQQSIQPGSRDGITQVLDRYQQNPGPVPQLESFSNTYMKLPPIESLKSIQRKAITGYTGYIPRSAWSIGIGYQPSVQQCMDEFNQSQVQRILPGTGGMRRRPSYWPEAHIYSPRGVLPKYTGFIPGFRDCFGETLGNTSRRLYQHSHLRGLRQASMKNAFNERNVLYN